MADPEWVDWRGIYDDERQDRKWDSFSWLTIRALLSSANDILGKGAPRLVNDIRGHWVSRQRRAPRANWDEDFVVSCEEARRFIVLGDPGEQDASQYAVVPALLAQPEIDFMVVLSDVIYPAGDVNDYIDGFYVPYRRFKRPIFAVPGNHDWYDGLNGFMWHFCGAEPSKEEYLATSYSTRERIARRLWRAAAAPQRDRLTPLRDARASGVWKPLQPGPYFAIKMAGLLVCCIDTGIAGDIDREQADWLLRVAEAHRELPKVLLTGKPILVDGRYRPGRISGAENEPQLREHETVDRIVRDPDLRFVAAIGGDTHNYQRYTVELGTFREPDAALRASPLKQRVEDDGGFHYIVSGGGGAYTSATHPIREEPLRFEEHDHREKDQLRVRSFTCYPTRADSLAFYSRRFVPALWALICGLLAALVGIGGAALLALVVLVDDQEALEIGLAILASVALLAAFVVTVWPGTRGRDAPPRPRRAAAFAAIVGFAGGWLVGLAGWWLERDRFDTHALVLLGLIVGGAVVAGGLRVFAWDLRRRGPWNERLWTRVGVATLGLQGLGALVILWLTMPASAHHEFVSVVYAFAAPVAVWGLTEAGLRFGEGFLTARGEPAEAARWRARAFSPAAVVILTALAIGGLVAVLDGHGNDDLIAAGTGLGALLAVVSLILVIDYARRLSPTGYRPLVWLAIAAGVGCVSAAGASWADTAAVAAAVLLVLWLLGSAVAHLTYLGAWGLLMPHADRSGTLTIDEARSALAWQADNTKTRPERRVRRTLRMVYPGTAGPTGPLQSKVAELFDADRPPFHKNFLVLDIGDRKLTVQCHAVQGDEEGSGDVEVVDTVICDLNRRPDGPTARR